VMRRWRATSAGRSRRCAGGPLPGRCGTTLRGLRSCSRVPMAWRRVIVTRCCMACSMPRTGWMRASAACWWAGHCAAESPGSAGPLWTGCVSSTGRERRCATPVRTLIGRCALGARPARLHRRRRSCRALRHRSRKETKVLRGLACRDVRRGNPPRSQATPTVQRLQTWRNEDPHRWRVADHGGRAVGLRHPEPRGTRVHRVRRGRIVGQFRLHRRPGEMDCREVKRDGRPGVEFSWEGNDECDPASGRGWGSAGG
jgi:hypothetical protein